MKSRVFMVLFLLLMVSPRFVLAAAPAKAGLINAQGKKVGKAVFKENAQGLDISLEVWDLAPGIHAMHIHETGQCVPPDFKSAKGHFNPENKKHGTKNPEGHHAGDLPNIVVAGNGKGKVNFSLPGLSLKTGPHAILKAGGTALVIHAGPDDEKTDPTGNAGDRVACGVIS